MPTPTTYNYSIAGDTANGVLSESDLHKEIQESPIVIAIDYVVSSGDDLDIFFKDVLSTGDKTSLDGIVAAHTGISDTSGDSLLVKVQEEDLDPEKKTAGGHYRCIGLDHVVPASDPVGDITYTDFSFPFKTALLDFKFTPPPNSMGDKISVIFAPNTIIGAITSDVTASDNVFNVSPTVLDNIEIGFTFKLFDGVNQDNCGLVTEIDKIAGTVTTDGSATNAFAAATPTYVQMEVYAVQHVRLCCDNIVFDIGDEKIGGSPMDKDIVFRFEYQNNEGTAKTFTGLLGFLY